MNVPLLDLSPQLLELREEMIEQVIKVIDSTRYIQGPEVELFEQEIADYSNAGAGIGVSSGTDALLVSLMALDIGPGDRVLTTPFSFFATMGVILRLGATPVFADIDPVSFNIDPDSVETLLEDDKESTIKAIIPVHLYGQCADMARITALAEKYGTAVIEDAAQAIGAEYPVNDGASNHWIRAGSQGIAGCFSFFPSKNLGGIGDGGMIVSSDESFIRKARLLRNHGAYPKYYHEMVGGNFRLDPIQAAVLRVKLKHLEKWHESRRANARQYNELFKEHGMEDSEFITVPEAVYADAADSEKGEIRNYHIYNQYVIRAERRDELRSWLADKKIATEIYYPLALHQQKCLRGKMAIPHLPVAEKAAGETLALPVYPGLTEEMIAHVVVSIRDFYR